MAPPVPLPRLYWWRIRNLDKEKQTLAAPLSKQQREGSARREKEGEERHDENEGKEDRGREGREAERTVEEWHLPTAIHRFPVHVTAAANVAMPHLHTPPSPSQAATGLFKKKKKKTSIVYPR